jgi:hypothetical protein
MSTEQGSLIGATAAPPPSDSGASTQSSSAEYTPSSTQDTSPAPQTEQTAGSATAEIQGQTPSEQPDYLADVPSLEELQKLPDGERYKKSLLQMREAIEQNFKPKLEELTAKYSPFEALTERFQTAEEFQPLIDLHDTLFTDFERDPETNQLVPATTKAAEMLFTRDPQRAGYLWAEMADKQVNHPETGQPVPLIDLALEGMRDDPNERAKALRILGGVEPSAQAPTWAPTEEQLAAVRPELQDIFRGLPYDEREDLSANTPDFINKYLQNQKFQQDLMNETQQARELQQQQQAQREQYQRQQAENAGNKYVEEQFRSGFTEFANSIVGKTQFIPPLDAESAKGLPPEQVTAYNAQAEQINKGVGMMVATVTAALSHPDTKWVAADFLKQIGVDEKTLSAFDSARTEFAQNARNYGELSFSRPNDSTIGTVQTFANKAMSRMKGQGNLVAQPLLGLLGKFFEMKATSYNATLNSAPSARPPVSGNGYDPTSAMPSNLPTGKMTREEINARYG